MAMKGGSSSSLEVKAAQPKRPQPVPRPGRTSFACMDCSLIFPTHQALGGHRRTHTRKLLHPTVCKPASKRSRQARRNTGFVNSVQVLTPTPTPEMANEKPSDTQETATEMSADMEDIPTEKLGAMKVITTEKPTELELFLTENSADLREIGSENPIEQEEEWHRVDVGGVVPGLVEVEVAKELDLTLHL